MATASRGTTPAVVRPPRAEPARELDEVPVGWVRTLEERLLSEPYGFDFFQAVRLLEKLTPERRPVGYDFPPAQEIVRFRAHLSLNFPASSIYELTRASAEQPVSSMVVTFMGLTGPSGVLPRHYTELLMRLHRDVRGPERYTLREWFDLFNHRLISLFYRSWTKYRFWLAYERGEHALPEPDPFTRCLFSLIGLGNRGLRNRLRVVTLEQVEGRRQERVLARVDDLALIYYGGFFAHRPRNAISLECLLHDYFGFPVQVQQFQGQWLLLDSANQSQVGGLASNNQLGVDVVVGQRVWDVQSKIRLRLGPLTYQQFNDLLPDETPLPQRKAYFECVHLARLYAGPELDIDLQLVLRADEVPECQLPESTEDGPQLGWNTWIRSQLPALHAADAVFEAKEVVRLAEG